MESYQFSEATDRMKAYAKSRSDFGSRCSYHTWIYNYVNPRLVKPYVKGYEGKDPQDIIFIEKSLYY